MAISKGLTHGIKIKTSTYIFRLSEEEKKWLEGELQTVYNRLNNKRASDQKVITKSQILIESLRIGFEKLAKK